MEVSLFERETIENNDLNSLRNVWYIQNQQEYINNFHIYFQSYHSKPSNGHNNINEK